MAKSEGPITPEVIKPGNPENRTRAYRIRRQLKENPAEVDADDVAWLHTYESAQKNRGASRAHKVQYTEESMEAEGTGTAAEIAAAQAAPWLAKEEGRRYDSLINAATQATLMASKATQAAYEMVLKMGQQVLERNAQLEAVHLGMLETVRQGHLARTTAEAALITAEAEAEAREREDDDGGVAGVLTQFMPVIIEELKRRGLAPRPPGGGHGGESGGSRKGK